MSLSEMRKALARAAELENMGRFEDALSCCDDAIRAASLTDTPYNSKAVMLGRLGRFREALFCHERAILVNPNSMTAHDIKAITLEKRPGMRMPYRAMTWP